MHFATLSLQPVYEAIKRIHSYPTEPPFIPTRRSLFFREYRSTYNELIQNISGNKAVYLWIGKSSSTSCNYIYVGESHSNKKGLRGRFGDEFNKWYHVFWMTVFNSDKYENDVIRMYNTPTKDYTSEVQNVSLKRGATHFIYCSDIPLKYHPQDVEADLIQLFGNPKGNAKDFRDIPFPEDKLLVISREIHTKFISLANEAQPYMF